MRKVNKIVIEYDDGDKDIIEGEAALLFQARVNSAGIMTGIIVEDKE